MSYVTPIFSGLNKQTRKKYLVGYKNHSLVVRVTREVVVKKLVTAAIIWKLDWGGRLASLPCL